MSRADDLATLFGGQPAAGVTFRQGVVVAWNPATAENTIRVGGTDLVNLPTLASSTEVLLLAPGDVVGIMVVGSGAASTMFIQGRITMPGTAQAASVMEMFGLQAATVATSQATGSAPYTDLATVGPVVSDVSIGATGRCQVIVACDMFFGAQEGVSGGYMTFAISGATTVAASDTNALGMVVTVTVSGAETGTYTATDRRSFASLVTGLNPGLHTFTAKYRSADATNQCSFGKRTLIVLPY